MRLALVVLVLWAATTPVATRAAEDAATPSLGEAIVPDGSATPASPTVTAPSEPPAESKLEPAVNFDDLSLADLLNVVVVSPSKIEQPIERTPSIITVIDAAQIRSRGYRTVADALADVPGVHVVDTHVYQYVGVRGIFGTTESPNDILKIMINGQSVAFRPTATTFLGNDLIPIAAIKRIEVICGPASALYGANAFLGVINIVTFDGTDAAKGSSNHLISVDGYASNNSNRVTPNGIVSATSGDHIGSFNYFAAAAFQHDDHSGLEVPIDAAADAPSPGLDAFSRNHLLQEKKTDNDLGKLGSAYARLGYQWTDKLRAGVDGHVQYNQVAAELAEYSQLTHETRLAHVNGFVRSELSYNKQNERGLSAELSAAVSSGRPLASERIRDVLITNIYKRRHIGSRALDLSLELRWHFSSVDHFMLGVDYTTDQESLLGVDVLDTHGAVVSREQGFGRLSFNNRGAYTQLLWSPVSPLALTLGARADQNSQVACNDQDWSCFGKLEDRVVSGLDIDNANQSILVTDQGRVQLSTRAAVVYSLPFWSSYLKLLFGSSFKPPSPYQLHHGRLTILGSSVGNPILKPQTSEAYEILIGVRPIDTLKIELTGFHTRVSNLVMSLTESGVLTNRNANLRVSGGTLNVDHIVNEGVRIYGNSSLIIDSETRPQRRSDETESVWRYSAFNAKITLSRFPALLATAGVKWRPKQAPLELNVSGQLVGERRASLTNGQLYNPLDLNQTYSLPPYFTSSLTISSVGLHPFAMLAGDTLVSLTLRGLVGQAAEPGLGGVDVPLPRVQLFLRLEQSL